MVSEQESTFWTTDLFLYMWLRIHGVPLADYERRGRYVRFYFEGTEEFKVLHLDYINGTTAEARLVKDMKSIYSSEIKDMISSGDYPRRKEE